MAPKFFTRDNKVMKIEDRSALGSGGLTTKDTLPTETEQGKNLRESRLKNFGLKRAKDFKVVGASSLKASKKGLEIAKKKNEERKQKKSETIQGNQDIITDIKIDTNMEPKEKFIKLRAFAKANKKDLTQTQVDEINGLLKKWDKENNLIQKFLKSKITGVSPETPQTTQSSVPTTERPETESESNAPEPVRTFEDLDATTQQEVITEQVGLTQSEFDDLPDDLKAQIRATKVLS